MLSAIPCPSMVETLPEVTPVPLHSPDLVELFLGRLVLFTRHFVRRIFKNGRSGLYLTGEAGPLSSVMSRFLQTLG